MCSVIEDPAIALIGLKRQSCFSSNYLPYNRNSNNCINDQVCRRFASVGRRLAIRKELYLKRRILCDASLFLALLGIAIMILETEICAADFINRAHVASIILKITITMTTIACLGALLWYHKVNIKLFTVNNSMEDWRVALTYRHVISIVIEMLVVGIHPMPGDYKITWRTTDVDAHKWGRQVDIPLDVVLSMPMFLRLYLVLRYIMLHSRLYQDASSQSLGALNRINFNFRFIFKSMMTLYPDYALSALMIAVFLISSWSLRLCEMYNDAVHARIHGSFLNSMWVVAITFLTIGYGDIVPNTMCGRGVAVVTGMVGAGCTALVVAVLARKLELSSAEKYVHDFVLEIHAEKQLKIHAADILKHGWRLYRFKKTLAQTNHELPSDCSREIRRKQSRLLRAIQTMRSAKAEQRSLSDNALCLLDIHKTQVEANSRFDYLVSRQNTMEDKILRMEGKLNLVYEKICAIASR